jgi:hypothetical protein
LIGWCKIVIRRKEEMSYFDEEYDYDTLANDADYIDEYDDEYYNQEYVDDGLEAWENYYHNIADEIE